MTLLLAMSARADVSAIINDTTVKQDIVSINVFGQTGAFSGKTYEYKFQFRYAGANVLGISFKENYAFITDEYTYDYDASDRTLTVTTSNIIPNWDGNLFDIDLQILPKIDFYQEWERSLNIVPVSVRVYGDGMDSTFTMPSSNGGNIAIDTINATQTYHNSFSVNYPNPFNYETTIFFSVDTPSKLNAYVYDFVGGRQLQEFAKDSVGTFFYTFYDAMNKKVEYTGDYEFPKGLYKVVLRANPEKIAVGHYRILFETDATNYSLNVSFEN
jgi:hypothetical protein